MSGQCNNCYFSENDHCDNPMRSYVLQNHLLPFAKTQLSPPPNLTLVATWNVLEEMNGAWHERDIASMPPALGLGSHPMGALLPCFKATPTSQKGHMWFPAWSLASIACDG